MAWCLIKHIDNLASFLFIFMQDKWEYLSFVTKLEAVSINTYSVMKHNFPTLLISESIRRLRKNENVKAPTLDGGGWSGSRPGLVISDILYIGTAEVSGVRVPVGARFLSSPRRPDRFWGSPRPLSSGYWGSVPGVKRPGREAYHSPPTIAEVKNTWIYISIPPYAIWRSA
jgi:hypothetical protein